VVAAMKVVQVPEGSVILLTGVHVPEIEGDESFEYRMVRASGHDRFTILSVPDGADIEVWGPDVDLAAKVRELLGG
jgi:hypothetical protein